MNVDANWAIFFDAGHTLLHPKVSVGQVYAEIAEHYNVLVEVSRLEAGFKQAWQRLKIPTTKVIAQDEKQRWKEVVRLSWKNIEEFQQLPFHDYFEQVYAEFARPERWSLDPDALPLLNWLKEEKIYCGILSNWDERLRPILKGHGLESYFNSVIISGELGFSKPDLKIFRAAEKSLPVGHFQYMLIGDDRDCDQAGAHVAGWEFRYVDQLEYTLRRIHHDLKFRDIL